MANYGAQDVKKLREETDAPMMECKSALDEADGNFDRAKEILREKGKAAAAKRVGRSTSAGVVAFSANADSTIVAGVVVECETDFVARNEDFVAIAQQIADVVRDSGAANADDQKVKDLIEGAVAKIRENIKLTRSVYLNDGGKYLTYVHHDRTKGAAVEVTGEGNDDAARKIAVQVVSLPPLVLTRAELPQEKIDAEIEIETRRAIEEGKPENIAQNIAKGRVNKEYIQKVVLNEQMYYADQSKTVALYLAESAKGSTIKNFVYLAVGQGE